MRKASGNKQLRAIFGTQRVTCPVPIGWTAFADIDGHIENRATTAAHELGLGMWRRLKVEPSHSASLCRQGMVVLYKVHADTEICIHAPAVCLGKEATVIAKACGCYEQDASQVRLMNVQDRGPFYEFLYLISEARWVSTLKAEQPALVPDEALLEVPGELRPLCEHR